MLMHRQSKLLAFFLTLALALAARADEITFTKTRYSSVKQKSETPVDLSIADSKILIKGRGKKAREVGFEIPFSSITYMSYEFTARHRVGEGAAVMALSLGAGAIVMATKTKSYWLSIEHQNGNSNASTVLRLDKSEYQGVLSALETRTGKQIAVVDAKTNVINPTAGSQNTDEVVPFEMAKVSAALKSAMQSEGCNVTNESASRIECKRIKGYSELTGAGGEKITARLAAEGIHTRVQLSTGKGARRGRRKNWSTPIYQEMLKNLQKPA